MKVEYLIGIIILLVVILLLIINYSKEGFTTDQLLHKNHSQLYQKKNNNVGAALIATNNQAALGSDTTGILGNIQDTMESNNTIVQKVVSDYPLEGGESGMSLIIKKCEAITPVITLDDCKKLDDPNINSTCGICLADPTNMGRNSEGSQWAGGLVLTASDRNEYRSQNRSTYGNNNNFLPDYIPTVGSCPAGRMVSTRAECERLQTQLMCQKSGTFDSSTGCSQCFKDGTYSIVDSSSIVGSGIIMVVGSGTLTYSEVGSTATTNPPIYLGLSPQPINLSGAEYTQIIITVTTYPVPMPYQSNRIYQVNDYIQYTVNNVNNVYRMQEGAGQPGYAPDRVGDQLWEARGTYADYPYKTAPPGFLAGYIQSPNGDGSEPMDLYRIILTDTITGRKPRVMGQINVNGEPLTKMGVGNGKLSMRLTVYSPFSFMSTLSQEATLCTGSPFITKPESARLLNSDPCYARGSGPGKYNLDCLQQVFQNNGCGLSAATLDKSAFPATNTKGAALMINSDGTFRNISDIADSIYQAAMSTATGLGADGNQLELSEWSNVSKFCTGVTINSPCDANAANGPLSPDCIIYLWDNKGENKITGATYSLTSLARSLFSAGRINRFCTRQGTKAPINVNNVKNQANIDYWMAFGGVDAVKREMSKLHNDANTSLTNEDTKAPSILQCYGIVPNPRVSYTSTYVAISEPNKLVQGTILKTDISLPENYNYSLSFDITLYGIITNNYGGILRITNSTTSNSFPPAYGERNPLIILTGRVPYIILGDNGPNWWDWNWWGSADDANHYPALNLNEKNTISIVTNGNTVTVTVNGVVKTHTQRTKKMYSRNPNEKYTIYASDNIFPAANAMIENINYSVNGSVVYQSPPAPPPSTGPGQSL